MNYEDIGKLLAYIAAFDKRTVGTADVLAWHDVLSDLSFDAAKEAVRRWYADNDGMIMPANVRHGAKGPHPASRPAAEVLAELAAGDGTDRHPFTLAEYRIGRDVP